MPLNTVTLVMFWDTNYGLRPSKRLYKRCIWDRPHGVISLYLHNLQLRVQDYGLRLSPVTSSRTMPWTGDRATATAGAGYGWCRSGMVWDRGSVVWHGACPNKTYLVYDSACLILLTPRLSSL